MPRCTLIISGPDGRRLLITRHGSVVRLPAVDIASDWVAAEVGAIQAETRRLFGIEAVVLRELAGGPDGPSAELECLLPLPNESPGELVEVDGAIAAELPAAERAIVAHWAALPPDAAGPPWTQHGWFAEATAWIDARLAAFGARRTGPPRQIKGAWSDSAVLAAESDGGTVFFKAAGSRSIEPAVLAGLRQRARPGVADAIAIELTHKWMLMRDAGGSQVAAPRFGDALRQFAELQRAEAPHADEWLALGAPDRRLATIRAKLERVLVEIPRQLQRGGLLSPRETTGLAACVAESERLCDRLLAQRAPDSLVHDDFQPGNVLDTGDGFVFLDWSDVAVAHPFFGAHHFIGTAAAAPGALRDAYLEPWTALVGDGAARDAFAASARLLPVYRAIFNDSMPDYEAWLATNPPAAERDFARGVYTAILDGLLPGG